jgi:hypothetical protein
MFLDANQVTANLSALTESKLGLRIFNMAFMLALLALFAYIQTPYTCLLVVTTMIFFEIQIQLHLKTDLSRVPLARLFRREVKSAELKIIMIFLSMALFFFVIKCLAFFDWSKNTETQIIGFTSRKIIIRMSEAASLVYPGMNQMGNDLVLQSIFTVVLIVMSIANRRLTVRYDNTTVEIFEKFFNRTGILLTFIILLGIVITRQLLYVQLSIVDFVESLLMVFFLTKTFGEEKEPSLMVLRNWTDFFRRLCVVKVVAFIAQMAYYSYHIFGFDPVREKQISLLFSKILANQTDFRQAVFWTIVVYLCYIYLGYAIRFNIIFEGRKGTPDLKVEKPYRTLLISYFAKNFNLILGANQISITQQRSLKNHGVFLHNLKRNLAFKMQLEYSLKTEAVARKQNKRFKIAAFFKKVFDVVMYHKEQVIQLAANTIFLVFLSINVDDWSLLSVCLFVYTVLIVRFDTFKVIWTASWAFCIIPVCFMIVVLGLLAWAEKQNEEEPGNSVPFSLAVMRMILSIKKVNLVKVSTLMNKYIRILALNTMFLGVRAMLHLQSKKMLKEEDWIENSSFFPKLGNLDRNVHTFFTFLAQTWVTVLTYFFMILTLLNAVFYISILNFFMFVVTLIYLISPSNLTLKIVCNSTFALLCLRFIVRLSMTAFHVSESFMLISGFRFTPFFVFDFDFSRVDKTSRGELVQNIIVVYCLFVLQRMILQTKKKTRLKDLQADTWLLQKVQILVGDLWTSFLTSLKKTKLFLLYFYTLYLIKTEKDHKEKQLNFLFIMLLLGFHVIILKRRGNLYNKTFIGLLSLYLVYLVVVFCDAYLGILTILSNFQIVQIEKIKSFRATFSATVINLEALSVQMLLGFMALKDILTKFKRKRSMSTFENIEEMQTNKRIYFSILQLGSVFMKDLLLFYIVSKFLIQPNIFKLFYVVFYLRYFFSQFRSLGQVCLDFRFQEIFAAKIRFFKRNLMNVEAQRPMGAFDFYGTDFRRLNSMYANLFAKKTFAKIYKKVTENWIYNFAVIFIYFCLIHYLNAERIQSNGRFIILNYFLNWKDTPGFMREEYQQTLIVLVVSVFEVYFVTITNYKFSEEEIKMMQNLPNLLLYRYNTLSQITDTEASTGEIVRIEEDRMAEVFTDCQELETLKMHPRYAKQTVSEEHVDNLNDFIPSDQKFILMSYIRSKFCCLQLTLASLHVLEKCIAVPILMGLLTDQISFFDLSLILLVFFFYFGHKTSHMLDKINFCLALFSLLDYLLMYLIDCQILSKKNMPGFMFTSAASSHCMPIKVLPFLIQYIAVLKLYHVVCTFACKLLMVTIDEVDQNFYKKIQTQVIKGKEYLNMSYSDWTSGPAYTCYKIKKNGLAVVGDFYSILLLVHFYSDSSAPSVICFVLLASYKLILVFQAKQTMNDLIDKQNKNYFRWLSLFNMALLAWDKWSMMQEKYNPNFASKMLFVVVIITSVLVIDCCKNEQIQEEKCSAEGYFKVMNHLLVLNQVYAANEHKIVHHTKQSIQHQYLEKLVGKRHQSIDPISEGGKAGDSSPDVIKAIHRRYKYFLESQVGIVRLIILKLKKEIRRKTTQTSCASMNFLSIVATYIEKNQRFVPNNYGINLAKIMNGEFKAIEELITRVEENKQNVMKELRGNYLQSIAHRIEHGEYVADLNKRKNSIRNLTGSGTPTTPYGNNEIKKMAKKLYSELSLNTTALKMADTKDNTFGDNFVKFPLTVDRYFMIWRYDNIRFQVREVEYWKTSFFDNVRAVFFVLTIRIEELVNYLLVVLFCMGHGFNAAISIGIIVFLITIEDRVTNLQMWKYLYLFFMLGFFVLISINSYAYHRILHSNDSDAAKDDHGLIDVPFQIRIFDFFYGTSELRSTVLIFIIMEIMIAVLSRSGGWNKTVNEIENPSQTYFRLAIQKDGFVNIFNEHIQLSISTLNALEFEVKQQNRKKLNEKDYTVFLINLIKRKTAIYRHIKDRFTTYLSHVRNLIPILKLDTLSMKSQKFNSYMWRNFSFQMRKRNVNVHIPLTLLLFGIIAFYFLFYFQLIRSGQSVTYIFEYNEVDLTLGLPITFLVFFLFVEQFVYYKTSIYWMESTRGSSEIVRKHLNRLNLDQDNLVAPQRLSLKTIFRTTLICARVRKSPKESAIGDYKHNPMVYRLYFTIAFFLINSLLVFFWIPIASNAATSERFLLRLFCTDIPNQVAVCNNMSSNGYLQIYYILVNAFCLLSVYQIKNGFSTTEHFRSFNFRRSANLLLFYVYDNMPFFKEIKTVIHYLASHSSLDLFKWFKTEDIEATVASAKATAQTKKDQGKEVRGVSKHIPSLISFGLFFLLLISPLYFFSDILLNNMIEEITSARLKGFIEIDTSRYYFYYNSGFTISKVSASGSIYRQTKSYENLKRMSNELFRGVSFSRPSQSFFEVNKEELKKIITDNWESRRIRMGIELKVITEKAKEYSVRFPFALERQTAALFLKVLTSESCGEYNGLQVTFGAGSKFVDLRGISSFSSSVYSSTEYPSFIHLYTVQIRCDPGSGKAWFDLFNEGSRGTSFVVLSQNIKNSVQLLRKFSSSKISIISIYIIIFSYFGLTLIRNFSFDNSHKIWLNQMPNVEKLEESLFKIRYSRMHGNLYEEERYFNKLIDLFRSPEKIKKLTGALHKHNEY